MSVKALPGTTSRAAFVPMKNPRSQVPNSSGTILVNLKDHIRAIEGLPAVWTATPCPQPSLFLRELVSLPQQYVPMFGQSQGQQSERLVDAVDVDYPVEAVSEYGPGGPGPSPTLRSLLRDALLSTPRQPAATPVAQDTGVQTPAETGSMVRPDASGTLADALHLESALLNMALDIAETAPSSVHPASAAMPPPVENARPCGQARVLVVDDDQDVSRVTSAFLRKAGFEVITVANGDQALAALSADPGITILVTDYAMVGTDGVELVLQARELRAGLPTLMITGYVGAEGLERLPADVAVLRKPFQRENFVQRVTELVEGAARPDAMELSDRADVSALSELERS